MANIISRGINRLRKLFKTSTKQKNITESLFNYRSGLNVANDELAEKITSFVNGQSTLLNFDETGDQLYRQMVRNATSGAKTYDEAINKIVSAVDDLAKEHYGSMYNISSYGQDEATKEVYRNLFGASSRETNSGIENSLDEILNIKYGDNKDLPNRISPSERRSMNVRQQALVNGGIENSAIIRNQALENIRKTYVDQQKLQTGIKRHAKVNSSRVESENNTSTSSKSTTKKTSTPESDAPSSGSTVTSTEKSDNKKTGTTKFVSSDDPRIGTVDSDSNFYMPDDISGSGISASAKQHAYRSAYEKAQEADKWLAEQRKKLEASRPDGMTDEEWAKTYNPADKKLYEEAQRRKEAFDKIRTDPTKIHAGLKDYLAGNPHTLLTAGGGATMGYVALQLSDSRGQLTNQQLYGQDDLT